ncbi:MAG TPA: carbon monoxide dehydrogenase subunit G [Xanthobacteraceae bacterium]|nr:carbon monoxide dehydrogenase subunit G [Xanthobacteraceae bacterium]
MDLSGEYQLNAPKEKVWAALNDPAVLARCIPGCKELLQTSDNAFAAKVALKVGPVSATFSGNVTLEDIDAPNGYRIAGQGSGGIAGFAKGGAIVRLEEREGVTVLTYEAKADIGGKLASLGSRLITATSKKLADQFFSSFAREFHDEPAATSQ